MTGENKELTFEEVKRQASLEQQQQDVGKMIQLIIFKLGDEEYALNIDQIKEVVLTPGIAKIPQTPDYIIGVSNIRGNIIAIVDLEAKFGLHKEEDNIVKGNYTLVVESDTFKIGILVKEVPDTMTVAENSIDNSSMILQYSNLDQECIKGIVKNGERMIILVDMIKMMEAEKFHELIN